MLIEHIYAVTLYEQWVLGWILVVLMDTQILVGFASNVWTLRGVISYHIETILRVILSLADITLFPEYLWGSMCWVVVFPYSPISCMTSCMTSLLGLFPLYDVVYLHVYIAGWLVKGFPHGLSLHHIPLVSSSVCVITLHHMAHLLLRCVSSHGQPQQHSCNPNSQLELMIGQQEETDTDSLFLISHLKRKEESKSQWSLVIHKCCLPRSLI